MYLWFHIINNTVSGSTTMSHHSHTCLLAYGRWIAGFDVVTSYVVKPFSSGAAPTLNCVNNLTHWLTWEVLVFSYWCKASTTRFCCYRMSPYHESDFRFRPDNIIWLAGHLKVKQTCTGTLTVQLKKLSWALAITSTINWL